MKYKTTQKDRYGNMRSLEIETDGNNLEVPPMGSGIPQYEAVGGLAENHPGAPKGSDTVPAWLTPGEFVVNKEAVDIYGPQIKKMNDVGRDIQDGDMNPNQAPPMYANAGIEVNDLPMWKQQLMEREGGYRSDIYDPFPNDGKWEPTTGYGHLLDASKYPESMKGKPGPFKTEAAAREQFEKDVGTALIDAQSNIGMGAWQKLQPQQQWGLTNMAFQLGRTKQAKFDNMIKAIQAEDYDAAKMHAAFNRNKNTKKYDIKTDWHNQTPTRVEDFNYFMSKWDPVNIDVPVSKPIGGSQPAWITEAQQLWKDMDKPKVEIPEPNPSSGSFFSRWFPGHSGEKNTVPKLDPSDEYDFKNKGGPIYASQGRGLGTYEEEMLKNLQHDYGNTWNPWDNVYSVGMDYGHTPMPASYAPPVPTPTPDAYADPNKITPPGPESVENSSIMDLIFPSGVQNTEAIADDLGQQDDSSTRTDMGGGSNLFADHLPPIPEIDALNDIQPGPFTGELGADEEGRAPLIPPMPGEEIIVGDGREDYRPSGFGPTLMEEEVNPNNAQQAIDYYQGQIDSMLEDVKSLRIAAEAGHSGAKESLATATKIIKDYEDKVKEAQRKLQLAEDQKAFMESGWVEDSKVRTHLSDLEDSFVNATTDSERNKIKAEIDKTKKNIEDNKVQIESQNKLAKLGSKIDNATETEIKSKLDSEQGQKVLDEKENKDDNDPEVSKTRQMFDFLFGDLIDGGEIGRAISVYLASRALGYNHDGSIGFVAKQYLKRVDAKNAQMDKWILANSHLYTKDSLANFKRTKDPSKLIRIGASPRSTGKKEMQYHKELGQMMAYEFKVKNTAGDDITYWSFDINGLKPELRVGSGWSDKNVNDVSLETIGQVNKVLTGIHTARDKHTTGSKDNKKTVYRSGKGSTPGIIPDAIAGETAQWLFDRDIPPGKFLQPLDDAYAALIASNQKLLKDDEDAVLHTSIIPFLEDATIKLRLENMMYKDKDGKMRPLPSPIKATVNGKERTMTNEDLVRIQQRIESVYTAAKSDIFWAEIAAQWKKEAHEDFQDDPKKKKTWREVFMKMAKEKDNAAYTPFGLFAESIIENEIADIGTSLQP